MISLCGYGVGTIIDDNPNAPQMAPLIEYVSYSFLITSSKPQIARIMGPKRGPPGADWTHVGPMNLTKRSLFVPGFAWDVNNLWRHAQYLFVQEILAINVMAKGFDIYVFLSSCVTHAFFNFVILHE